MCSARSILLIDYEASVREVLQVCLSEIGGWNVIAAASFEEGLALLPTQKLDAIIMDNFTGKRDSTRFIQKLKANPLTQSIPILLITHKASWYSRQHLQDMSVVGAIAKPFDPVCLPAKVSQLLGW
ncbi:response regulator [Phormidium sp. LEGE 05292]|uniref:response regulator n=1 Tax=[Phormidium] sp. LEGE 05292 TaxID=767427 RepID=UPI00188109FF|nr:response regulator [Phormidium sp. LEGE 05292]MBE9230026.1 response regulator [Phormidium sp. LEGE 05292]